MSDINSDTNNTTSTEFDTVRMVTAEPPTGTETKWKQAYLTGAELKSYLQNTTAGPSGPSGPSGPTGPKGSTGEAGPQGTPGTPGAGVTLVDSKESTTPISSISTWVDTTIDLADADLGATSNMTFHIVALSSVAPLEVTISGRILRLFTGTAGQTVVVGQHYDIWHSRSGSANVQVRFGLQAASGGNRRLLITAGSDITQFTRIYVWKW